MNSVSWFIYLGDVAGRTSEAVSSILLGTVVAACFAAIFSPLALMMMDDFKISKSDIKNRVVRALKPIAFGYTALFILYLFLPSQNALYAVAASEIGERVVQSEQVRGVADDATKALRQWIKRQIEPEKQQK
jgi:hypothetical protein